MHEQDYKKRFRKKMNVTVLAQKYIDDRPARDILKIDSTNIYDKMIACFNR